MSALSAETLVLNKGWVPITTVSVKEALLLLFKNVAKAVNVDDYSTYDFESWADLGKVFKNGEFILTPRLKIPVPDVIVLETYCKIPSQSITFSRANLLQRDMYMCQYCSKQLTTKNFTIDHVIPRSKGGKSTWQNTAVCCGKCNYNKRDRTPEEAGMTLIKKPIEPPHKKYFISISPGKKISWDKFLKNGKARDMVASELYWNSELKD